MLLLIAPEVSVIIIAVEVIAQQYHGFDAAEVDLLRKRPGSHINPEDLYRRSHI